MPLLEYSFSSPIPHFVFRVQVSIRHWELYLTCLRKGYTDKFDMGSKGVHRKWRACMLLEHANYSSVWHCRAQTVQAPGRETKDIQSVSLQTVSSAIFQDSAAPLAPESHPESMCWWLKRNWSAQTDGHSWKSRQAHGPGWLEWQPGLGGGDSTEVRPHRCRAGSGVNDVVDTVKK